VVALRRLPTLVDFADGKTDGYPKYSCVNDDRLQIGTGKYKVMNKKRPYSLFSRPYQNSLAAIRRWGGIKKGMGFDTQGNVIDLTSHKSHAMNPIMPYEYERDGAAPPPRRFKFRCMFCGAFDNSREGRRPCSTRPRPY
jgi:hypothetical protein